MPHSRESHPSLFRSVTRRNLLLYPLNAHETDTSPPIQPEGKSKLLPRRGVIRDGLALATAICLPTGAVIAGNAEVDAHRIEEDAHNRTYRSASIPDNNNVYIAKRMNEENVTKRRNRGISFIAGGGTALLARILLGNSQNKPTPSAAPLSPVVSPPPDQMR